MMEYPTTFFMYEAQLLHYYYRNILEVLSEYMGDGYMVIVVT